MSSPVYVRIGQRIASRRRASGLSQRELAKRVGITPEQLRAYEEGTIAISASHLWDIADAQGARLIDYFEGEDEEGDG